MEICWRLSLWNAGGDLLLSRSSGLLQSLDRPEASSDGECFPAVIGNDNTSPFPTERFSGCFSSCLWLSTFVLLTYDPLDSSSNSTALFR